MIYEVTKKLYNSTFIADFFPIRAKNLTEAKKKVIKRYNLKLVNPKLKILECFGISIDLVKPE